TTLAQAPRTGAVRYTHRLSSRSETTAGASDRAGFIDAPLIGPANRASRAMTDPTGPACQFIRYSGVMMAKRHVRQKHETEAAPAERPTQKRALAEALRRLGPNASPAALARFVKEEFGMELTFCMLVPKAGTARKSPATPAPRRRCA